MCNLWDPWHKNSNKKIKIIIKNIIIGNIKHIKHITKFKCDIAGRGAKWQFETWDIVIDENI